MITEEEGNAFIDWLIKCRYSTRNVPREHQIRMRWFDWTPAGREVNKLAAAKMYAKWLRENIYINHDIPEGAISYNYVDGEWRECQKH